MATRKQNMSSTYFLENAKVISKETNPNIYSRARLRDIYRKYDTAKYRRGSPTIKAKDA
jgi:hypothetical protein